MKNNNTKLKDLFSSLQSQMVSEMDLARTPQHPVLKGDATELNWLEVLKTYLPKRYVAEKAFVIDSKDQCSEQIDIVIYDRQYTPLLFEHRSNIYVPAESLYAVFEVKQSMDKNNLEYASKKAQSVRRLTRTSMPIPHAGGSFSPKKPARILAGILCSKSAWSPAFGEPLKACLKSFEDNGCIDIGCCIDQGVFEQENENIPEIQIFNSNSTLVVFLLRLIVRLQTMATVPMADMMAYIRQVDNIKIRREFL